MVKIGLNWEGPDDLSAALLLLRASLSCTFSLSLSLSLILDKTLIVPRPLRRKLFIPRGESANLNHWLANEYPFCDNPMPSSVDIQLAVFIISRGTSRPIS